MNNPFTDTLYAILLGKNEFYLGYIVAYHSNFFYISKIFNGVIALPPKR